MFEEKHKNLQKNGSRLFLLSRWQASYMCDKSAKYWQTDEVKGKINVKKEDEERDKRKKK